MKGNIDLKKFITGVKEELVQASKDGSTNPFFELPEVELQTEFSLEASASAEGGFKFLIKVGAGTTAGQSHKVLLKFKPLPVTYLSAPYDTGPTDKNEDLAGRVFDDGQGHLIQPVRRPGPIYRRTEGPLMELVDIRQHLEQLKQQGVLSDYKLEQGDTDEGST